MNKILLILIIAILTLACIGLFVYMDEGSRNEELAIISQGEWQGYYELTLNNEVTHEDIMGGGSLNFTIKRDKGDKLKVFVNDTFDNERDLAIKLFDGDRLIAENSSSNHLTGVFLFN